MARRKKKVKKVNPKKAVSEEPDGDYVYMHNRKELLKDHKKKMREMKRKHK